MTVRDFILLDQNYQSTMADIGIMRLKRLKLGFRLADTRPSNEELIDNILMREIRLANSVLSTSSPVRIPSWISEKNFNSFIAKIATVCN